MPSALNIAGEVAGSAATLAGLILVFLGAITSSFHSYEKTAQAAVRGRYQRRAWFSFGGFVLALVSASLALLGKWLGYELAAFSAALLLLAALILVLVSAIFSVMEIR